MGLFLTKYGTRLHCKPVMKTGYPCVHILKGKYAGKYRFALGTIHVLRNQDVGLG